MCLQEIFILGKQSLWVGLYCNNHSSQHKLNTSFSICFYLPSSWASFMSSIWMSGVRWTHLSLKQWKVPSAGVVPRTLPHWFAALGPRWTYGRLWQAQVPRTSFHDIRPSPPRLPPMLYPEMSTTLLPGPRPPEHSSGQCHHLCYDESSSFPHTDVSLHIIKNLKQNNLAVVFFTNNISKVNNLLFLWQK